MGEVGDIGVAKRDESFGNMGLGLCMGEPSDPLLRLARGIPYPVAATPESVRVGTTSPNKGFRR